MQREKMQRERAADLDEQLGALCGEFLVYRSTLGSNLSGICAIQGKVGDHLGLK
jgi:hypothetical protein